MKKTAKLAFCFAAAFAAVTAYYPAEAATVDTIDATSGQANTYFVPSLGQELNSPYYRGFPNSSGFTTPPSTADDWGWTHNPVVGPYISATLSISAFDVDFDSGERDAIFIGSNTGPGPTFLGFLQGSNNAFSFTDFNVSAFSTDLAAGLQVWIAINTGNQFDPLNGGTDGWLVSLAKSVITTDGASPGDPNPGATPLPAALPLFATGLGALGLLGWRRKKKRAAAVAA